MTLNKDNSRDASPLKPLPPKLSVVGDTSNHPVVRRKAGEFVARSDGLWRVTGKEGDNWQRLTICDIEVLETVRINDGTSEEDMVFRIAIRYQGQESIVSVRPDELERVTAWIGRAGIARTGVMAGGNRYILPAITLLSDDKPVRQVYSRMGWTKIDGELMYLHAGGAIGKDGSVPGIDTDLAGPLGKFCLPAPPAPDSEGTIEAVRGALALVNVGDDTVTMPLLAAVWRAAMGNPDWSVLLTGQSGIRKSTLAALAQSFWDASSYQNRLPTSFSSTANSIIEMQFRAGDAVLVVDEYVPNPGDEARSQSTADRIVRGTANHSARNRLRPDGTPRQARPPRALTVLTGEALPDGVSLRARMLVLPMNADTVPVSEALTKAQKLAAAGIYNQAMAAWVQYLAGRNPATLRDAWGYPTKPTAGHSRIDTTLHEVTCVWNDVLSWALDISALTEPEAETYRDRLSAALDMFRDGQRNALNDAEPWRRYLRLLRDALSTGRAQLRMASDTPPTHAGEAPVIGWIPPQGDEVWLSPVASFAVARRLAADSGRPLGGSTASLGAALLNAGQLLDGTVERVAVVKRTGGGTTRVWVLPADSLGITADQHRITL